MELLNVYDNDGNLTDRVVPRGDKSVILSDNEHIGVVVVFIENSKGEFLIQKTSLEKGSEYSSTGGHVDAGETHLTSILREIKEELGIEVNSEELEYLGFLLYDKPIRFMYYLKKDIDIKDAGYINCKDCMDTCGDAILKKGVNTFLAIAKTR